RPVYGDAPPRPARETLALHAARPAGPDHWSLASRLAQRRRLTTGEGSCRLPERRGIMTSSFSPVARARTNRAVDLAGWSMVRLIHRADVWGAYRRESDIGKEYALPDGTKIILGSQRTVTGALTLEQLKRHFAARERSFILGCHAADANNLC